MSEGEELSPRQGEDKDVTCALYCYLVLTEVGIQAASSRGNGWGASSTSGVFNFTPIQVIVGVIPVETDGQHCHPCQWGCRQGKWDRDHNPATKKATEL